MGSPIVFTVHRSVDSSTRVNHPTYTATYIRIKRFHMKHSEIGAGKKDDLWILQASTAGCCLAKSIIKSLRYLWRWQYDLSSAWQSKFLHMTFKHLKKVLLRIQ